MMEMEEKLIQSLKNVKIHIEALQGAMDLDQAANLYKLCRAFKVDPVKVLGEEIDIVDLPDDPRPSLLETLADNPALLDEMENGVLL